MKVLIWVHKDEAIKNEIEEHHLQCPMGGYMNYVQIIITQDEFVRLEDKLNQGPQIGDNFERF